jgi:hypothetical protein
MKDTIKKSLKALVTDRYLLILLSVLALLALGFAIAIGLSIHSSDLQLVSHYTAFGMTHLYRDQWYYLVVFVLFELIVAILHIVISIKLLVIKGHSLAVAVAWYGVAVVVIGWIIALAVLNVWTPL